MRFSILVLRFSFPFCRSPILPWRFFFEFCRFPSVSCITVAFPFRFTALLGGAFCSSVPVIHPPALLASPQVCVYLPCVVSSFLRSCFSSIFFFFSSFPSFAFDLDVVCSVLSLYLVCEHYMYIYMYVYAVFSVSVSGVTRVTYCKIYMYSEYMIRIVYADLNVLFLSEVHDWFQLLCGIIFCFICFSSR